MYKMCVSYKIAYYANFKKPAQLRIFLKTFVKYRSCSNPEKISKIHF